MNAARFDALIRAVPHATSRRLVLGALTAGLLTAATSPSGLDDAAAKRKKQKKTVCHDGRTIKVPKKTVKKHLAHGDSTGPCPACKQQREACAGMCCGALQCEEVPGCAPSDAADGPYCCAEDGGGCQDACDCCGQLECSERRGSTCRECGFAQDVCDVVNGDDDCCLNALMCENNGCELEDVCCLGEGSECGDGCDCCAAFGCAERADFTCQTCGYPTEGCDPELGGADCCLETSSCGVNCCGAEPANVCCQGAGARCIDDCDCCDGLACDGATAECVATDELGTERGIRGRATEDRVADHRSGKARWFGR